MQPTRRELGKIVFAAAQPAANSQDRVPADPFAPGTGIKIGHRFPPVPDPELMAFYRLTGIEYASILTTSDKATYEYMVHTRKVLEDNGIRLMNVNCSDLHCDATLVLGLPGAGQKLERFRAFLRDAGRAGIPYTTYGHTANLRLGYGQTGKGRTREVPTRLFDMEDGRKMPLSHGRIYTDDEIWATFERFAKTVVPAAEEAGVKIGLHPDDPPVPSLGGVARIFRNIDSYERAFRMANSPALGFCLCVGTWAEGGSSMGKDVLDVIRQYGPPGKIFKVHFRNIDQPLPRFQETIIDAGMLDMRRVMLELRKANFTGAVVPDHIQGSEPRGGIITAYTIGYMRALRTAVNAL